MAGGPQCPGPRWGVRQSRKGLVPLGRRVDKDIQEQKATAGILALHTLYLYQHALGRPSYWRCLRLALPWVQHRPELQNTAALLLLN